ncbi:GNAT family N-acetyltransferase [Natranaeroarchaeum sulfidigenes]|uniref:Peptidoglycan interpeptide bridge formation enzyme, contains acetyltransferase domain of GNAT superfamily n=1 Tax=Natranaeroarchaeum sulfidigenes TaxID=2784880 RepID=A0A897MVC9_9EURY|nr:GNAT family N-acetyltransferase [Natranaeroarchaeum sulfidigenes]QSG03023.1 Peptidoglycan interpeptide bridge formation enzyme, contains acetyltransferase domain of GNAT superfamily [Natranaeroarchaeum sulfidigenes]
MSIEIERFGSDERDRWNRLVERSPQATPFHRYEALEVLAEDSGSDLHPLVGFKGQEPVGILPLFGLSLGPITAAFSPPPDLKVSYLGPALLNFEKLKQRKAERRHDSFVDACVDYLDAAWNPNFTQLRTGPWYEDPRPFAWNEFDVDPAYTYVVDLTPDRETLLASFSSDARKNATDEVDADVEITVGDRRAVKRIITQVIERHAHQGESYKLTPETVTRLYGRLGRDRVRPYVCTVDGAFVGGVVTVEDDRTVYRWQGGAKPETDVPINDRLDWRIMTDAMDRGLDRYDLVGANNQRLCGYKAKFAPDLYTYYSIQHSTHGMGLISGLYKQIR